MAKRKHTPETYYDTSSPTNLYVLNPDGTYTQTSTSGAAHVHQIASDVSYPEQWYSSNVNLPLGAGAVGRTAWLSGDLTSFNATIIEVLVAPTGTTPLLQMYPSLDGTNYAATPLAFLNLTSGAIISGATGLTAVGIYAILSVVGGGLKFRNLEMRLNGGGTDVALAENSVRFLSGVI